MTCTTPGELFLLNTGSLLVTVSFNRQQFDKAGAFALEGMTITNIHPSAGSTSGHTLVTLSGASFIPSPKLVCSFGGGSSGLVSAMWVSSTTVVCRSPAVQSDVNSDVTGQITFVPVEVSLPGVGGSSSGVRFMYRNVGLYSLDPSNGPRDGSTLVTVYGLNFDSVSPWHCIWGLQTTAASTFAGHTKLQCLTPPYHSEAAVKFEVANEAGDYAESSRYWTVGPWLFPEEYDEAHGTVSAHWPTTVAADAATVVPYWRISNVFLLNVR